MDELLQLIVPQVETSGNVATMQLPDIDLYNFWNLYNNRIFCIDGEITAWDYQIAKMIMQINIQDIGILRSKRKPIIILINSNGGLLNIANTIVDTIISSKTPVWTVNMGEALSGGCSIFLAGARRFTMPNSWCMCHAGSGEFAGNYAEVIQQTKTWGDMVKSMQDYILDRTGLDAKVYNKYKNKDWYLNADQQIEYGFATEMIDDIDQIFGAE